MILSTQVESIERVFGDVNVGILNSIMAELANALAHYNADIVENLELEFDFDAFFVTKYMTFKDELVIEVGVKRFGVDKPAYWFFVNADFEVVYLTEA